MLKGEIYIACSLLCFGFVFFMMCYIGLQWWLSLAISLVPAIYFVRKAVRRTDKFTNGVSQNIIKKMK